MKPSQRRAAAPPRSTWLILAAILLLAAGLRLTRLGLVEFKFDEATTARSALTIARDGQLPAVGMVSSEGPRNPALMSYVLALPFAISRDPRLAAGWLALLGVAAAGATYWMGQTFFGWRVGALAAALFAASPWAVFQSRKLWTQNLPLLTLLFVASALALAVRRRPWALAIAMAAAASLVSLHLAGLAFFFVLGAVLILFHKQVRLGPLLLGSALLLTILSPYLVHDARNGWANLRALWNLRSQPAGLNLRAFAMAARVASGYHFQDLAGARHADFLSSVPRLLWIDGLEVGLFWLGLLWATARVVRAALNRRVRLPDEERGRLVLLCWFLIPVLLLTRRTPVQPHDFNLLYPVQHLIIALFLTDVVGWIRPRLERRANRPAPLPGILASILVVAIVIWQVVFQQALLSFVDNHQTPDGHGAPVKDTLAAAQRASSLAAREDTPLVVLLPGAEPRFDGPAAVFDVLLPPGQRRLVDGRGALVLPQRTTTYVSHPHADEAASLLTGIATEVEGPLPLRTGSEDLYRFFLREPDDFSLEHIVDDQRRWVLPSDQEPRASVAFLGYAWEGEAQPGGTLRWITSWRVDVEPSGETDVHWFNHLVDEQGERWGQQDGAGLPPADWRAGDVVVTWFDVAISPDAPPPPYWMRTGLYTYPDTINVPLVDVSGDPAGQFLELGPIDAQ